mmetsp:Transcript_25926/g.52841  ORF Transcript_25926/g.52841 Transcript_25926/m.52841 type:complete len:202 (-) Transcript_25926:2251-2856(-)
MLKKSWGKFCNKTFEAKDGFRLKALDLGSPQPLRSRKRCRLLRRNTSNSKTSSQKALLSKQNLLMVTSSSLSWRIFSSSEQLCPRLRCKHRCLRACKRRAPCKALKSSPRMKQQKSKKDALAATESKEPFSSLFLRSSSPFFCKLGNRRQTPLGPREVELRFSARYGNRNKRRDGLGRLASTRSSQGLSTSGTLRCSHSFL